MNQPAEREIDLRHYARVLWRRKWYALIPPVVLLATALLAIPLLEPTFQVSSVVIYEARSRMAEQVERFLLPTDPSMKDRGEGNTGGRIFELKILSSAFLEGVVRNMGLDDDPKMRARADEILARSAPGRRIEDAIIEAKVLMLRNMIAIEDVDFGVYRVLVSAPSQGLAYEVGVAINEHLLISVRQEQLSEIKAASDFSNEQMEIYKAKLEESQQAMRDYLSHGPSELPQTSTAPAFDARAVLELLNQTEVEIDRATADARPLRVAASARLGTRLSAGVVSATENIRLLGDRLSSFERQLAWLLIENTWTAPAVVSQNQRIQETRKDLRSAIDIAVQAQYPDLERDAQAPLAELAVLDRIMASLEVRRESLRERVTAAAPRIPARGIDRAHDPELAWLQQKVDTNREIYNSFLQQITSSRITEAVESTKLSRGFQIVEPPRWPNDPVAPNKMQILLAVLAAGASLGIGLVFFVDFLDHSLKDVDEIERVLGLRIVGTIPKITPAGAVDTKAGFRRRAIVVTVVCACIVVIVVIFTLRRTA